MFYLYIIYIYFILYFFQHLCTNQRLEIYRNPEEKSEIPSIYCGIGSFSLPSASNRLEIIYRRVKDTEPGFFFCSIDAISD